MFVKQGLFTQKIFVVRRKRAGLGQIARDDLLISILFADQNKGTQGGDPFRIGSGRVQRSGKGGQGLVIVAQLDENHAPGLLQGENFLRVGLPLQQGKRCVVLPHAIEQVHEIRTGLGVLRDDGQVLPELFRRRAVFACPHFAVGHVQMRVPFELTQLIAEPAIARRSALRGMWRSICPGADRQRRGRQNKHKQKNVYF